MCGRCPFCHEMRQCRKAMHASHQFGMEFWCKEWESTLASCYSCWLEHKHRFEVEA